MYTVHNIIEIHTNIPRPPFGQDVFHDISLIDSGYIMKCIPLSGWDVFHDILFYVSMHLYITVEPPFQICRLSADFKNSEFGGIV